MPESNMDSVKSKKSVSNAQSGLVAGGYANLVKEYEKESRLIIEDKYAEEWNASGLLQRWWLQRKMDREIAELIAESIPKVSREASF